MVLGMREISAGSCAGNLKEKTMNKTETALAIRQKYNSKENPVIVTYVDETASESALDQKDFKEFFKSLPDESSPTISVKDVGTFKITACKRSGRLAGKIVIITGSAQGFGAGMAEELLKHGCYMVYSDLNLELAKENAETVNKEYGEDAAIALGCDITDEAQVEKMIEETILTYGGLDIFVANAGIVLSGPLTDFDLKKFDLVTKVNYTGFFICAKEATRFMKLQHELNPTLMTDIIQINSKSGLEGSNKNFAYSGSKFGGIGLTQSFAKELIEFGIKVNAVCPGNFYEGPLWADPETGLFVQYLKAGKVPKAKTVEDVKEFYMEKVPLHRGCYPSDVTTAILYCVEQTYETGQAIPVTGGQNMLT